MPSPRPTLVPIFRSDAQMQVLSAVFLYGGQWTIGEVEEWTGLPHANVSREVARLSDAGWVRVVPRGRSRMVEANFDLPYANAIVQLLDQTVGVFYHVHDAYQEMPGVDRVIIFGSWAARYHGPAGPPPNDVDIAVVGSMDPFDARVAGTMIENRSRVTVQVVTFTYAEWDAPSRGSFVDTIKQRPTVVVLDRTERGKDDAEHSESGNRVESA